MCQHQEKTDNLQLMNNHKLFEIDILRGIAALAVITIHVTAYFTTIPNFSGVKISMAYLDNLAGFAVPTFIFISGLVLYKNYQSVNGEILKFYRKRFAKILPIYLLFSFGYFGVNILFNKISGIEIHIDVFELIYKLATGGAFYHLWYFGVIFQFYLLYPLLLRLYKKYKLNFVLLSFLIQCLWNYFGDNVINDVGKALDYDNFLFPFAFSYIFWFVLGFYFLENKDRILSMVNIKIGLILILILNGVKIMLLYYGLQQSKYEPILAEYSKLSKAIDSFFFLIEIIVVYKISLLISNQKTQIMTIFKSIGGYSLEIYLIHALIIRILFEVLARVNITPEGLSYYPIMWVLTIALSYVFAVIYRIIDNRFKKPVPKKK